MVEGRVRRNEWYAQRQETVCEGFPIRHENDGTHDVRKLFAKVFLFDMRMMVPMTAGNCSQKVSYSTWDEWYS